MAYPRGTPRPPNSGRKKGTPNKNSVPVAELADLLGINPAEILLRFASGDAKALGLKSIAVPVRAKAAADAAKYIHAQKHQSDLNIKEVQVTIRDYTSKVPAKEEGNGHD